MAQVVLSIFLFRTVFCLYLLTSPVRTLRPPPNADFIHGYPGIPSDGVDRPHAAVKGTIEVRVNPPGIKAKWVRVELRKVETLPGGGPDNTFYDSVGPSPVNLWQATEDYALLQTQDFPFSIRIPESVPPSVALENRAGITYELVATACVAQNWTFRKPSIVATMVPINIKKHELHSTWPIYLQPERRQLVQGGLTLIVDRAKTCFVPGDRVSVIATVILDRINAPWLNLKFHLKEAIIFRRPGRKSIPSKTQFISEYLYRGTLDEKSGPSETQFIGEHLYRGTQHQAELFLDIPSNHQTPSLSTARHIDVTYVLCVQVIIFYTMELQMTLPVVISNWPRPISIVLMGQIGFVRNLSSATNANQLPPGHEKSKSSLETDSQNSNERDKPLVGMPQLRRNSESSELGGAEYCVRNSAESTRVIDDCYMLPRVAETSSSMSQPNDRLVNDTRNLAGSSKLYSGQKQKLVLTFDVGSTYSGVGYSILNPGEPMTIYPVTSFPWDVSGSSPVVPSVIYYDKLGKPRLFGAEADLQEATDRIEDEGWSRAERFKLHLEPQSLDGYSPPPLPPGKTIVDVWADFLAFLYSCAAQFIQTSSSGEEQSWRTLSESADIVFSHRNGWKWKQQEVMRLAAIKAGIVVDDSDSDSRLHFVTEGEASLYFFLYDDLNRTLSSFGKDSAVIVVDAGGETVHMSTYALSLNSLGGIEEVVPASSVSQGSVSVTKRAQKFVEAKLAGSAYDTPEDIERIIRFFDKKIKPAFQGGQQPSIVRFGNTRDNDPHLDIRAGRLSLSGDEVKSFFKPSVDAILAGVASTLVSCEYPISTVFLTGGLSSNGYLFSKVQEALSREGIQLIRSECIKPIPIGSIFYFLNNCVSSGSRRSKWTYGIGTMVAYNPGDPEHEVRPETSLPCGERFVRHKWDTILRRGTLVDEGIEIEQAYALEAYDPSELEQIEIVVCRTREEDPKWLDDSLNDIQGFAQIAADTSSAARKLTPIVYAPGRHYYSFEFKVVIKLGGNPPSAQVAWAEDEVQKRSAAVGIDSEGSPGQALLRMRSPRKLNPSRPSRNKGSIVANHRLMSPIEKEFPQKGGNSETLTNAPNSQSYRVGPIDDRDHQQIATPIGDD